MKTLTASVVLATALSLAQAQSSATVTNRGVLYMTNPTSAASISNAVKIASGLRLGMTGADVQTFMREHGMTQTNIYSLSSDRGRTWTCSTCLYPLAGGNSRLMLEMQSRRAGPGPFDLGNQVLTGAHIQCGGADIISITLTNGP